MNSGFEQYVTLETAYRWLNCEFFEGKLPGAILTLQRHHLAYGYFAPGRFASKTPNGAQTDADEIALNPDEFTRQDIDIFATLLHELCHQWQAYFGKPSRQGYHNQEWSTKMQEVGLIPSSTGAPGGALTGQHMSHYIDPGGKFANAYAQKLFKVEWVDKWAVGTVPPSPGAPEPGKPERGKKYPVSKQKYSCPTCGLNAWAKPGAHLKCSDCDADLIAQD